MKKVNRSTILRQQRQRASVGSKKQVMARLAYHYLKTAKIELEPGEVYDANKIARGLGNIYQQAGKDEGKAKMMITEAGEYFNEKGLSWKPITVWNDWELIRQWKKQDNSSSELDISERREL